MSSYRIPPRSKQLHIANNYLQRRIHVNDAAYRLRQTDTYGRLLAGEVLMDDATRSEYAAARITRAGRDFRQVLAQTEGGRLDYAHCRAQAGIRLAQLGVAKKLFVHKQMPSQAAIGSMQGDLLKHSREAAALVSRHWRDRHEEVGEVRGALGKMAVLLLAGRYILKYQVGDLVPTLSTYSATHGGNCEKPNTAFAWDVDLMDVVEGAPASQRSLNIMTQRTWPALPEFGPTVYLEDLGLAPGTRGINVSLAVVQDCLDEHRGGARKAHAAQRLDDRTELLIDAIERASVMPVVAPV